jgi:trigger factor
VRLGLLLSEIGQQNGVEVSQAEMQRLAAQAAQQYDPKDRQRFLEYIQQDPIAAAQLRAPLYEDKVVDFLFAKADISDRAVSREELEAAIEEEDGFASGTHIHDHDHDHHDHDAHDHHDHDHADHDHAEAKPKKAAKKTAATTEAVSEAPAEKKPAAKKVKKAETVEEPSAEEAPELHDAPAPKKRATKKKAEAEG